MTDETARDQGFRVRTGVRVVILLRCPKLPRGRPRWPLHGVPGVIFVLARRRGQAGGDVLGEALGDEPFTGPFAVRLAMETPRAALQALRRRRRP